jgi:hypothetical protein
MFFRQPEGRCIRLDLLKRNSAPEVLYRYCVSKDATPWSVRGSRACPRFDAPPVQEPKAINLGLHTKTVNHASLPWASRLSKRHT